MAIKASATITLSFMVDVKATYRYYKLQASTATPPSKPTEYPPSGWTTTEPSYTTGSTNTLYFVDCTVFTNNTFNYSAVSVSSAYEAAKEAFNKAVAAGNTANSANDKIDNLQIGGRNLIKNSSFENGNAWYISDGGRNNGKCCKQVGALTAYATVEILGNTKVDPGDVFTFSGWYKTENIVAGTTMFLLGILASYANSKGNWCDEWSYRNLLKNTDDWIYISKTFVVPNTSDLTYMSFHLYARDYTGTIWWDDVKLEKGTKATDWTPAPEDVDEKIDNIQVGGRNLLLKTKDYSDWVGRKGTTIGVLENDVGETSILQVTTNGSSDGDVMLKYSGVTKNEKHLLSFYARNISGNQTISFEPYGGPVYSVQATAEWKKFEVEIIPNADTTHYFFFHNKNNVSIFQLKNVKLEKGTKATDWTPAPEDVESSIEDAKNEAAKTATNYIYYDTSNGLQIGDKSSGEWAGTRAQIKADSYNILNQNGVELASFGANEVRLGNESKDATISMRKGSLNISNVNKGSFDYTQIGCKGNFDVSSNNYTSDTVYKKGGMLTTVETKNLIEWQNLPSTTWRSLSSYTWDDLNGPAFVTQRGTYFETRLYSEENDGSTENVINGSRISLMSSKEVSTNKITSEMELSSDKITFNGQVILSYMMPVGYIFQWIPTDGGPDLSTADKVREYFGFGMWTQVAAGRVLMGAGETGIGISSITAEYYLSTSETSQTGGSWTTTPPTWSSGKYIWTRSKIVYTNPSSIAYTTPLCASLLGAGGRNLWLKTKDYDASAYTGWVDNNNGDRQQTTAPYTNVNGFGVQRISGSWSDISQRVAIEPNTVYTLSAWIKLESSTATMYFFQNTGTMSGTVVDVGTDDYKRVSVTFNSGDATISTCRFECGSNTPYLIYGLKLEKGNRATDWTPAPEDVDSAIADVEYYLSTSATSLSGGSWVTTAPTWVNGKYMWSRTKITIDAGITTYSPSQNGTCIAGANAYHSAGSLADAGLPNITGHIDPRWHDDSGGGIMMYGQSNGALYNSRPSDHGYWWANKDLSGSAGASTQYKTRIHLDASRCSSIYGNSATVQPPALFCYMWKRIS